MDLMDSMQKFQSALPPVREWIDKTLKEYEDQAVPVMDFSFPQLNKLFPHEILSVAKAVVVNGKVPFPPLSDMGFPEFAQTENMNMIGVTYKDTFFVSYLHQTESLFFHEMVHIVQWERLGVDAFLLSYGAGLMQFGYEDSPLEQMAYILQADFDRGELPPDMIESIQQITDNVWKGVAALIPNS